MSLNPEQLQNHCETILASQRILGKIVILCEGDIPKMGMPLSPSLYRKMENMPDSNFYKACIPQWWKSGRPQFFNCGDKKDVIDTYFLLLKMGDEQRKKSYLDSKRLFALIDLDLQKQDIPQEYSFSNTEEIFHDLYEKGKVNEETSGNHKIWTTGLIHKEAYFFLPRLQEIYDEFSANYQQSSLQIERIHRDMIESLEEDKDLQNHWNKAHQRINYCSGLDLTEIKKLKDTWKKQFEKASDSRVKQDLVSVLLTIKKAKSYWHKISPPNDWTSSSENFHDQLMLRIGECYARQEKDSEHHLPTFFRCLHSAVLV